MSASSGHNKKRNSALLYEFLVRAISSAIVDNDEKRSAIALRILKRNFKPGTELYREFRLANALAKTTVGSEHTAASIIFEAKRAAREHDVESLEREKSRLIHEINKTLRDPEFYDRQIDEYRELATVQQLLNSWREQPKNIDVAKIATLEEQLFGMLTKKRVKEEGNQQFSGESVGMNRFVMRLMMKNLNERYSGALLPEQRDLLKSYAFSAVRGGSGITQKLQSMREDVVSTIDAYVAENASERYVCEKLNDVRCKLLGENLDTVDDALVTRFMLYMKLSAELRSGE